MPAYLLSSKRAGENIAHPGRRFAWKPTAPMKEERTVDRLIQDKPAAGGDKRCIQRCQAIPRSRLTPSTVPPHPFEQYYTRSPVQTRGRGETTVPSSARWLTMKVERATKDYDEADTPLRGFRLGHHDPLASWCGCLFR